MKLWPPKVLIPALMLLICSPAIAQWTNQTIVLHPGWNAIYLEVQPEPADCDLVFAGIPVESVWAWNRRFTSVQYIQDPSALIPGDPDWLFYTPPSNTNYSIGNLFSLISHQAYLIKMPAGGLPVTWTVTGKPAVRKVDWVPNSLNLAGFPVNSATPPTFQSYFAASSAHSGAAIHQLNASGSWVPLNPATDRPEMGRAYWVYCNGASSFPGPLALTVEQGRGLDYDRILTEQTLRIRNNTASARMVVLLPQSSANPPGGSPLLAGPVPLSYWTNASFVPMTGAVSRSIPAGAEWALRLAVRRPDMAPSSPPPGRSDVLYQSLLQVTDDLGSRLWVPVTAKGSFPSSGAALGEDDPVPPNPKAGLWVGTAVIRKVNQPAHLTEPDLPRETASQFQFRLLVHIDNAGQARLLSQALLMWTNGTDIVNSSGYRQTLVPGRQVLVPVDSLASHYSGSTLRDGQAVARRFSSAAFSFPNPLLLTNTTGAAIGSDGSAFTTQVVLDYDDPANPFKHRYHPDHNNLDERFETRLPEGVEAFTVRRLITLRFSAQDPEGLRFPGWGDTQIGGAYQEAITGLHRQTLRMEGTFRLSRASQVGSLEGVP